MFKDNPPSQRNWNMKELMIAAAAASVMLVNMTYGVMNATTGNEEENHKNNTLPLEWRKSSVLLEEENARRDLEQRMTNTMETPEWIREHTEKIMGNITGNITGNIADRMIKNYSIRDRGVFNDNDFYETRRTMENRKQIEQLLGEDYDGTVLVINKTFQKATLYAKDSIYEWDCATALKYGAKERNGDGKTPEGVFRIQSIMPSQYNTFDGKKAYGPYFCRLDDPIFRSIGLHGNGTDTVKVKNWQKDRQYMPPDPLGISSNNFGYGVSHGCIRLDNHIIAGLIENGKIKVGTKIIIYEDQMMTESLKKHYEDGYDKMWRYHDELPGMIAYHTENDNLKNDNVANDVVKGYFIGGVINGL